MYAEIALQMNGHFEGSKLRQCSLMPSFAPVAAGTQPELGEEKARI